MRNFGETTLIASLLPYKLPSVRCYSCHGYPKHAHWDYFRLLVVYKWLPDISLRHAPCHAHRWVAIYKAHRAVIFAIAQFFLSLRSLHSMQYTLHSWVTRAQNHRKPVRFSVIQLLQHSLSSMSSSSQATKVTYTIHHAVHLKPASLMHGRFFRRRRECRQQVVSNG